MKIVACKSNQIQVSQSGDSVNDIDFGTVRGHNNLSAESIFTTEKVNSRLRTIMHRLPGDDMNDTDKHSLNWSMFMTSTMKAAVFLGKDYLDNLHPIKNAKKKLTIERTFATRMNSGCTGRFWHPARPVRTEFGWSRRQLSLCVSRVGSPGTGNPVTQDFDAKTDW